MKFDVFHRWSGEILFTAKIDCSKDESVSVKLGLAVKWAIENKTNLRGADLKEADLSWTNLRGADLRGANLKEADLKEANLRGACLLYTSPSPRDS